jgi:hypothetical protein
LAAGVEEISIQRFAGCERGRAMVILMPGKCPKCGSAAHVVVEAIRARDDTAGKTWPAVLFLCDRCHTILSVSLDPDWQAQIVAGQLKMVGDGN